MAFRLYLYTLLPIVGISITAPIVSATESADAAALEQQIETLRVETDRKIQALQQQLNQVDTSSTSYSNAFNPQLSVILDGAFVAYSNDPEDYHMPGFTLGGEAGLADEGFHIGHTEITASANVDGVFYGQTTIALHSEDGDTEVEIEEAFVDTLALPGGISARAGRFFPSIGYINQQHNHAWDFADAPLIYRGLWGDKYIDDGLRVSVLLPTEIFVEIGSEALSGGGFPAGGDADSGVGGTVTYAHFGGDFGASHSWSAGVSYFTADVHNRSGEDHDHGGGGSTETPEFSGDSDTLGIFGVYKWAPQGNYKYRSAKLQFEYFQRDEKGVIAMAGSDPLESTAYTGDQSGYYIQGVYQFMPQWTTALRYDAVHSANDGSDQSVFSETGLDDEGASPRRWSAMLAWAPSEFSRIRLQYNRDKSSGVSDNQWLLQYTMSLGAHGAHSF